MVAHVYTGEHAEETWSSTWIPSIYTKDSLILRIQRRLNTVWELRTPHRIYQYLGIPMKARSKDEDEKEERLGPSGRTWKLADWLKRSVNWSYSSDYSFYLIYTGDFFLHQIKAEFAFNMILNSTKFAFTITVCSHGQLWVNFTV